MLYIVSTPIGNLKDITLRALEVLKSCDYILCEDTRHTLHLLHHYEIHRPVKSFHKHNEGLKEKTVISDLQDGKNIALVSDAGTPGISDPGMKLVQKAIELQLAVMAVPGACAAVGALSISGLDTERFQFLGFLPRKKGELQRELHSLKDYEGTTICFESPQRVVDLLEVVAEILPDRHVVIVREMTKKFEETLRDKATVLFERLKGHAFKGEIVLLIEGRQEKEKQDQWLNLTSEEHVKMIEELYCLSHRDAIKMVAQLRGVPKREIYNKLKNSK